MANILVIGATGDVGRGICEALIARGHQVAAAARNQARLEALGVALGVATFAGTLDSDDGAAALRDAVLAHFPKLDGVAVAVNAPRERIDLLSLPSAELAGFLQADLVAHFTAARTFLPALAPGGCYVGIGGGSADFILEDGAQMSVAQAGLRMLYRAFAHQLTSASIHLRELIIASVVNGASTSAKADPAWVTAGEVGEQVAAMIERPGDFPEPVWRIARRDSRGRPMLSHEGPTTAFNRPLVEADLGAAGIAAN